MKKQRTRIVVSYTAKNIVNGREGFTLHRKGRIAEADLKRMEKAIGDAYRFEDVVINNVVKL